MSDELSRVADRLRQNRAASQRSSDVGPTATSDTRKGRAGVLAAGDRAFDVVSGRDAVVVKVGILDGLLPSDVQVRFADGSLVTRSARELLWRPAPPSVAP